MLTSRELATVLAALRHWQQQIQREGVAFATPFPHFSDDTPLSVDEIDSLCDLLNEADTRCDCELPGMFRSGVPGILAHREQGRLALNSKVERCDLCRRFASDDAARERLIALDLAERHSRGWSFRISLSFDKEPPYARSAIG